MTDQQPPRKKPRSFNPNDPGMVVSTPEEETTSSSDTGDLNTDQAATTAEAPSSPTRLRLGWGALLFSALFGLGLLAAGAWFARFISITLDRQDWVGWTAWGLLGFAALAALVLSVREIVGFIRLGRLTHLRRDGERAIATGDPKLEKQVVKRLKTTARSQPHLRWDLDRFREDERHMQAPGQLLGLADRVLLANADKEARKTVYRAARRVGIVTAVVPVAFIVVLFVLFENLAMIRRLAGVYGGRPGFLGGIRLFWWIIGHIAATGMVALTDDLWGQFFGQDVARRVSKRLGEGAFNGALTARLGVAALEICRPLPHLETKPPRVRDILKELFPEITPGALLPQSWRAKDDDTSQKS